MEPSQRREGGELGFGGLAAGGGERVGEVEGAPGAGAEAGG